MAYREQKKLLKELIKDHTDNSRGLSLAKYLIQSGVVLPEALSDAECSRAWLMGEGDGGQDYSPKSFRESLLLVSQRAFATGTERTERANRIAPGSPE